MNAQISLHDVESVHQTVRRNPAGTADSPEAYDVHHLFIRMRDGSTVDIALFNYPGKGFDWTRQP